MMGKKERVFSPLPKGASLEDLVPEDNFYRRLEERLDLSFVRDLARPLYARGGRPSVDPVVFFKLERFGLSVFRRFFERIVEECAQAGLVRGEELFFDSTKVEGNAAVDSLAPRWAVEAHLGGLFEEEPEGDEPPVTEGTDAFPSAGDTALRETNAARRDWVSRDGAQDRSFSSGYRPRTSDSRASTTDPDATPMTWLRGGRRLGYQAHYVVDGGKARVILNALVTPSEVTENRPMLDLLWRTAFRWRLRPHHVTGDAKYGTRQNVAALETAGVRAYVALPNFDFRKTEGGFFGPGHFRFDAERDVYVCPAGELLRWRARTSSARGTMYRAKAEACNACGLKERCTGSKNGRTVYRPRGEDHYDRVRRYRGTRPYEKALRKRVVWVEPLFAEAKAWHGMGRFRLRTLRRVNAEALMVAAGQNLKRLLAFGGRGPERPARASALPLPTAAHRGLARTCLWRRSSRSHTPRNPFRNRLERLRSAEELPSRTPSGSPPSASFPVSQSVSRLSPDARYARRRGRTPLKTLARAGGDLP